MLRIHPLGGLGEIGLNAMVVEFAGERLLVDAGLLFPTSTMPGVDAIVPDFAYLRAAPHLLTGIVLTHGHEDHVGALAHLLRDVPVPVYGAPFTLALVRHRLEEHGIEADLRELGPRAPVKLGQHLTVEAVQTCHSMPDAYGYLIGTPAGSVVHTGDYKVDPDPPDGRPTDLERYAEAGERGVLCLLADSTNSEVVHSTGSERTVAAALEREMRAAALGRIVVSMFASNIVRLQAVFDAAKALGRKVVLSGRSMVRNVAIAKEQGLLRFADDVVIPVEAASALPRNAVVVLTTGSQAEPRSGLVQMTTEEHELHVRAGDLVILSARPIPGNERAVSGLIDGLSARGAHVIHAGPVPDLHVSGHASPDQQRQLIQAVRPKHFVPIHGELHHLQAQLITARNAGVPEGSALLARNGDVITFDGYGRGQISERLSAGRLYRDRFGDGELDLEAIAERVRIGETGVVVAAMVYDRSRGVIAGTPTLDGRGLSNEENAALGTASQQVGQLLAELTPSLFGDDAFARDELARAVRRVFKQLTGKRPAVIPIVLKV